MKKYCPHCRTTEHKRKVLQWVPLSILSIAIGGFGASGLASFVMVFGGFGGTFYLITKGIAGRFEVRWECEICKNEN